MIYPEIKTKDKKNSFSIKIKLPKKGVIDIFTDSENLIEFKKTILEVVSYEVNSFIINSVNSLDLDIEQSQKINSILNKVSVTTESELTTEEVSEIIGVNPFLFRKD